MVFQYTSGIETSKKFKIMYKKFSSFLIILILLVISCKNQNNGNELLVPEEKNAVKEDLTIDTLNLDITKITDQLQGKWRENEYPHRTAEFMNSTVKFVEEGIQSKPAFEKFAVGQDCQFSNNNIKDLKAGTIILNLPESNRCEKLKVSNDTLILSGFSTNTNKDYNIVYLKTKR